MLEASQVLTEKLEKNRMILKWQLFFLQNLIPKNFVKMIENYDGESEAKHSIQSYSLSGLDWPLCLNFYSVQDYY